MGFVPASSNCRDWFKHSKWVVPIIGLFGVVHLSIMNSSCCDTLEENHWRRNGFWEVCYDDRMI